ncbi:MAG: lipid-A-disaccharide synthase [Gammaproteobacteria bacterium]|nr:lipid-A-disaccharide synthase [Gammaproteobacteria bacterium]
MSAAPVIVLVAGEASGDQLGAALIHALRALCPGLRVAGVAGPAMREAGCETWFDASELSVMGLAEVVRHLPRLARRRDELVSRVLAVRPAVYVGIDAPDFNLRIERAVRRAGIRTVQYVAPSVWAWRSGRVSTLREACNHVLCLLPFEQPFLAAANVTATFVGHPFADEISPVAATRDARAALGIDATRVVGILPGSRMGEVTRLGPDFLAAGRLLRERFPDLELVAPMAGPHLERQFRSDAQAAGVPVRLFDGRARDVMAASDLLLIASGTATLEAMLVGRPMVVAYRFAALTYWLARGLRLVKVRHFALPNLLADSPIVPELLQHAVTPTALADSAAEYLRDPVRSEALRQRFSKMHEELRRDASGCAARVVAEVAGW